jgi:hypothetical protein
MLQPTMRLTAIKSGKMGIRESNFGIGMFLPEPHAIRLLRSFTKSTTSTTTHQTIQRFTIWVAVTPADGFSPEFNDKWAVRVGSCVAACNFEHDTILRADCNRRRFSAWRFDAPSTADVLFLVSYCTTVIAVANT